MQPSGSCVGNQLVLLPSSLSRCRTGKQHVFCHAAGQLAADQVDQVESNGTFHQGVKGRPCAHHDSQPGACMLRPVD
eukprot:350559-Chlamydomonas_euryale.AAC.4